MHSHSRVVGVTTSCVDGAVTVSVKEMFCVRVGFIMYLASVVVYRV
jgi:hypothetical protein